MESCSTVLVIQWMGEEKERRRERRGSLCEMVTYLMYGGSGVFPKAINLSYNCGSPTKTMRNKKD